MPLGRPRRLLPAAALLMLLAAPRAHAEPGEDLTVYALTFGPGDHPFFKFGHNALWVQPKEGQGLVFNFGTFGFDQPNLIPKFLKGRLMYWLSVSPVDSALQSYQATNRTIEAQELDLTPAEREGLYRRLLENSKRENREYLYDYFWDNCSTRVRDAIDVTLGGKVKVAGQAPAAMTLRAHALRLTSDLLWEYVGLHFGLGQPTDRPMNAWNEAFLPEKLRDLLRTVRVERDGVTRPLVKSEQVIFAATRPTPPAQAPHWEHWFALVGVGAGGLLARAGDRGARAACRPGAAGPAHQRPGPGPGVAGRDPGGAVAVHQPQGHPRQRQHLAVRALGGRAAAPGHRRGAGLARLPARRLRAGGGGGGAGPGRRGGQGDPGRQPGQRRVSGSAGAGLAGDGLRAAAGGAGRTMKFLAAACLVLIACGSRPPPPAAAPASQNELDPRVILELMTGVADRQLAAPVEDTWQSGAFLAAALELGELTGDPRYQAAVRAAGEAREWKSGPLSLAYLTLFGRDRDRRMSRATLEDFDRLCESEQPQLPEKTSLPERALTLSALTLASDAIGRPRYRACANRLFGPKGTVTGADDDWTLLAVTRLLESETDAAVRERYRLVFEYLTLGTRKTGAPVDVFELRAFAAGLNRGFPVTPDEAALVRPSWLALAPGPRPEGPEAAAAFLMAGAEVFRLTLFEGSRARTVTVSNPLAQPRFVETAEIPWPSLARALGAVPGNPIIAVDGRTGQILPSQLLDENGDAMAEKLLVSLSLSADESRPIVVRRLARPFRPARPAVRAYGRFVAEGRDDFAWENDRVAFRVYGPALEPRQTSSGIDVWAKRVREPVIDRWYRRTDLHRDQGEGLDFYRVGPSLGCGGWACGTARPWTARGTSGAGA